MTRTVAVLLILGVVLAPFAVARDRFDGLSLLGVLAVLAAIILTIYGAPRATKE